MDCHDCHAQRHSVLRIWADLLRPYRVVQGVAVVGDGIVVVSRLGHVVRLAASSGACLARALDALPPPVACCASFPSLDAVVVGASALVVVEAASLKTAMHLTGHQVCSHPQKCPHGHPALALFLLLS